MRYQHTLNSFKAEMERQKGNLAFAIQKLVKAIEKGCGRHPSSFISVQNLIGGQKALLLAENNFVFFSLCTPGGVVIFSTEQEKKHLAGPHME